MLLEDSKKIEKYRRQLLKEKEREALDARAERLKQEVSVDLDLVKKEITKEKPKKIGRKKRAYKRSKNK